MARQIPKNVRQIGNVSDSSKIYIEDFVETFLNQLCEKAENEMQGAFLIGEKVQEEENDYVYVSGAIRMEGLELKGNDIVIEEDTWKKACETSKEFFGDKEILGWFVAGNNIPVEIIHNVSKIHQKYFSREQSVFITKGQREKAEKYYIYKFKEMIESLGHYIYYEKNTEMQNYMVCTRKEIGVTPSEVIEDRAAKSFRSIVQQKLDKKEMKGKYQWKYALAACLALVLLIVGVVALGDYDRMKNSQETIGQIAQKDEPNKVVDDDAVEVMGQVTEEDTIELENNVTVPEVIPENEEVEAPEGESEPSAGIQMEEIYIVEKGDTLASISKKVYGDITYVSLICELNSLEDGNLIFIGQKLLLPQR